MKSPLPHSWGLLAKLPPLPIALALALFSSAACGGSKPPAPPLPKSSAAVLPHVQFTDITQEAGITFQRTTGAYGNKLFPESLGGGAAFFDFDDDGLPDLMLVNATNGLGSGASSKQFRLTLYHNLGNSRFEDVTRRMGLNVSMYGMGIAIGDFNNDGYPDVFVTGLGENRLFQNIGGKYFRDVTATSGLASSSNSWSTSAAFFDYDNDGYLDLFVCGYVAWNRNSDIDLDYRLDGFHRAFGPAQNYPGSFSHLYRNNHDGTFSDVSAQMGIDVANRFSGQPMGKSLAVLPIDLDGDGWIDLFVTNDSVRNFLFHNLQGKKFEEIGEQLGLAFDRYGRALRSTGIDAGDLRNDGSVSFVAGNAIDGATLLTAQGTPFIFTDQAMADGIYSETRLLSSFGVALFDYDLDGRLDLLFANGHLESRIDALDPVKRAEEPPQLFWNTGSAQGELFVPVSVERGYGLGRSLAGRGITYADIDGDGDLDVLITQLEGPPLLLRNDQNLGNHWIRLKLIGNPQLGCTRDAIGAVVELRAGGVTQKRQVMPTRGFLSQVELPLTFGLGKNKDIESVRVFWPGGTIETIPDVRLDALNVIRESEALRTIQRTQGRDRQTKMASNSELSPERPSVSHERSSMGNPIHRQAIAAR